MYIRKSKKLCPHSKYHICKQCKENKISHPLALYTCTPQSNKEDANKKIGPDLLDLLLTYKTGDSIRISKNNVYQDTTNFKTLQEKYGNSVVYIHNKPKLSDILPDLATLPNISFMLKIYDNKCLENKTDKQILSFCLTNKKWKIHLENATISSVLQLWTRISGLKNREARLKGQSKVDAILKHRAGLRHLPHYLVKLPYTEDLPKNELKQIANLIMILTQPHSLSKYSTKQTKVVFSNRRSIASQLVNNTITKLDPNCPPKCLGLPYCTEGIHYSKPIYEKKGDSIRLSNINAYTIPVPDRTATKNSLYMALAEVAKASAILYLSFTNPHLEASENIKIEANCRNRRLKDYRNLLPIWPDQNDPQYKVSWPLIYIPYNKIHILWKHWNKKYRLSSSDSRHLDTNTFISTIKLSILKYKENKVRTGYLPEDITHIISKLWNCKIRRFANPFIINSSIMHFNSPNVEDIHLGSLGNAFSIKWVYTSLAEPVWNDSFLIKTILHATLSLKANNTNTLLLLPIKYDQVSEHDRDNRSKYNLLLSHPQLLPILSFDQDTLQLEGDPLQPTKFKNKYMLDLYLVSNEYKNRNFLNILESKM